MNLPAFASAWWSGLPAAALEALALALAALWIERRLGARGRWRGLTALLWWSVLLRLALPPGLGSPLSLQPWLVERLATGATSAAQAPGGEAVAQGALALWAGVAAVLATLRAVRGAALRRRWLGAAEPVPSDLRAAVSRTAMLAGLRRAPRVRVSHTVDGPLVTGLLAPVVLLPASALRRPPVERFHALLHECVHIRRGDGWRAIVVEGLTILAWWHPGAWWARASLADGAELATDERVAAALRDEAPAYRRTLLRWGASRVGVSAAALPFRAGRAQILVRLAALETAPALRQRRRELLATAAAALLVLVLLPPTLRDARSREGGHDNAKTAAAASTWTRPAGCLALRFTVLRELSSARGG